VAHRAKESSKGRTYLFVVIDDNEIERISVGDIGQGDLALGRRPEARVAPSAALSGDVAILS